MNENLEIVVALLVTVLITTFAFVFTGSSDTAMLVWFVSFALTFLAAQTFKEDK